MFAKITSILGSNNISLDEVLQKVGDENDKATITLVTHETHEAAIHNAVAKINALEVASVERVLRVVS